MGKAPTTDESRRANAAFINDEHNFIDMERTRFLIGKEHTILNKRKMAERTGLEKSAEE